MNDVVDLDKYRSQKEPRISFEELKKDAANLMRAANLPAPLIESARNALSKGKLIQALETAVIALESSKHRNDLTTMIDFIKSVKFA